MISLQRMQMVLGCHLLLILFLGCYVSSRQLSDDYDLHRLYSYYKRYPASAYNFGLGKRALEEPASYEETGYQPSYMEDEKRAAPSGMYSFGLGKRNQQRYYGFGLGKRLEQAWRGIVQPSSAMFPSFRQERRSKIYSFGLGKRQSPEEDDYENTEKRSQARQFSFGLGKRDTNESDRVKSTS